MKKKADIFRTKTVTELKEEYNKEKQGSKTQQEREEQRQSNKKSILTIGGFFLIAEIIWFFLTSIGLLMVILNSLLLVLTISSTVSAILYIESEGIKERITAIENDLKTEIKEEIQYLKESVAKLEKND